MNAVGVFSLDRVVMDFLIILVETTDETAVALASTMCTMRPNATDIEITISIDIFQVRVILIYLLHSLMNHLIRGIRIYKEFTSP